MTGTLLFLANLALWNWQSHSAAISSEPTYILLQPAAQDTVARKPAQFFVVLFSLGEAWQKDKPAQEQLYFKEHSANLKRLRQEKKLLIGGRYSDKGMLLLSTTDEAAARAEFEADPMIKQKLFVLELYPFAPFYKGCIETQ